MPTKNSAFELQCQHEVLKTFHLKTFNKSGSVGNFNKKSLQIEYHIVVPKSQMCRLNCSVEFCVKLTDTNVKSTAVPAAAECPEIFPVLHSDDAGVRVHYNHARKYSVNKLEIFDRSTGVFIPTKQDE